MTKENEVIKAAKLLMKFCQQRYDSLDFDIDDTEDGVVCNGCPFQFGWCTIRRPASWDLR